MDSLKSALLEVVVKYVLPPLVVAIGGLAAKALLELAGWLQARKTASKAAYVGAVFSELASSVVAHLDAEMRPLIAKTFEDGRITAEEGAILKAEAMRLLVLNAKPELAAAAKEIFGASIDTYLSGLIERAHAALAPSDGEPRALLPANP